MRETSSDELRELLERRAHDFEADWSTMLEIDGPKHTVDGDWVLEGPDDWSPAGLVVITGNLVLRAGLVTLSDDALIVLGDVRCATAWFGGATLIGGTLRASSWVGTCTSNDYALTVGGVVHTKVFIENGTVTFADRFECEVWRTMNEVRQGTPPHAFEKRREPFTEAVAQQLGLDDAECGELFDRLGHR